MDATRFASMWAGLDTGNESEAEAISKFRVLRRKVAADNRRIIDVLELPEVKAALDAQMQPVRHGGDTSALQAENDELRARLAEVIPKVTELAEALKKEKDGMLFGCLGVFLIFPASLIVAHWLFGTPGVVTLLALIVFLCWFGREQKA